MTASQYVIAFIALFIYYIIGRYIVNRISGELYNRLFLKYYSLAFVLSSFLIIIIHIAYIVDGDINGLPPPGSHSTDSVHYFYSAEAIINHGYSNRIIDSYNIYHAIPHVLIIVIQFLIFGINSLIITFFNAFLFSLTLVLFGKFVSYYFGYKSVKKALIFFICYFSFISYTVLPLKEIVVLFFSIIVILQMHHLKQNFKLTNLLIFIFVSFILFYLRAYVAAILIACSIIVIFVKMNVKSMFISSIVLITVFYIFTNYSLGGISFAYLYESQDFYIGTWKSQERIHAIGANEAIDVILSGRLNFINLVYVQVLNTFFRPFITSYPRAEEFITSGGYITKFINYLGSFLWYFILPSIIYGFYHMLKNRKDLTIIYLPVIVFFIFFLFTSNQLRYQTVTRIFWIFIAVYGFQFYPKWKKYIPLWVILYIVIAIVTL